MTVSPEGRQAMEAFRRAVASAAVSFEALLQQRPGSEERVSAVVETLIGHLKTGDSLLISVLSGGRRPTSPGHAAVTVSIVALRIGMELGYSHPQLSQLGHVALLHEVAPLSGHVADQDAKIVALAVTYDRLARQLATGPRAWPPLAVKEILRRERARFPDAILKAFIQISVQFPVGALVRLNSGEVARVVAKNDGLPLRPVVLVAARPGKPGEPRHVDLRDNPFLYVLEFLGHTAPDAEGSRD